jgi:hypothetical protein
LLFAARWRVAAFAFSGLSRWPLAFRFWGALRLRTAGGDGNLIVAGIAVAYVPSGHGTSSRARATPLLANLHGGGGGDVALLATIVAPSTPRRQRGGQPWALEINDNIVGLACAYAAQLGPRAGRQRESTLVDARAVSVTVGDLRPTP